MGFREVTRDPRRKTHLQHPRPLSDTKDRWAVADHREWRWYPQDYQQSARPVIRIFFSYEYGIYKWLNSSTNTGHVYLHVYQYEIYLENTSTNQFRNWLTWNSCRSLAAPSAHFSRACRIRSVTWVILFAALSTACVRILTGALWRAHHGSENPPQLEPFCFQIKFKYELVLSGGEMTLLHSIGALFWVILRCRSEVIYTDGYLLNFWYGCGCQPPCCLRVRQFRHLHQ